MRISDHALLRLIERGGGFPVESLRATVTAALSRATAAAERINGGGRYRVKAEGLVFIVQGGVCVTVYSEAEWSPGRASRDQVEVEPLKEESAR